MNNNSKQFIMRISNLFMMGLLSTFAFTSCSDNEDNSVWEDTGNVVFNSQITGVQSRVNGATWDNGDEIGIFMQAGDVEVANKKYTAQTNGSLTAAAGNELHYPAEGTSSFLAYYPFSSSLSDKTVSLSVADQTNPSKIDFLYSNNATGIKSGETVNLAFAHQLSNIVVNITGDETISTTQGILLSLNGMNTSATFNLNDGKLTAADSKAIINMNVNAEGTKAQAIVLPASDEGVLMTFQLSDMKFEHALKAPDAKGFEAGFKYTYNATLSIFNGQPSITLGNATITDWTDKAGGDIDVDFEGGHEGEKPATGDVLLNENFDANQGQFTINDITLPEGSTYVWKHDSFDNKGEIVPPLTFMKASAFVDKKKCPSESWLVSPAVALPADKAATLAFNHCHKFSADKTKELTLLIAQAGTEVTTEATGWTEIAIPTYGSGNDYNYVLASVDLSAYKGQNIQFAYRYISTTESASTWQISDVKVYTGENGETPNPDPAPDPEPEPEPEPTPGDDGVLFNETFGTPEKDGKFWPSVDKYTGWTDTHNMVYSDPVMAGSYSNASVRSTSTMDGHVWFAAEKESALKIAGFKTEGYTSITLTYSITANKIGEQDVIKVSTDNGEITVPTAVISTPNKYQEVSVTLPTEFTYIQFTSKASTNTVGYRIDNVKVTGSK